MRYGDVPKWLKGPDSKSGRRRKACGGSNPSISATSEQSSPCSDVFMPTAEKSSSVHSFEPSFQTRSTGFGLLPPLCGDSILLRRNINFNGSLQGCVAVPGLSTKERRDQKSGDDNLTERSLVIGIDFLGSDMV